LIKKVNPKTDKIKIKEIKQTKTNSIVMEFDTRSNLQKFKDHSKLVSLKIEGPKKRNPLIIIYDIDNSLIANELKENIKQNLDELFIEEKDIVPRFKTGPRDKPTVHWVIQMAPRVRKHILQQRNRLYCMGFSSLKVRDFLQVARCMKCHDLGHVAKHCSGEERCGKCSATDKKVDCKSENQVCIPCSKRKLKCNTNREDCPSYRTLSKDNRKTSIMATKEAARYLRIVQIKIGRSLTAMTELREYCNRHKVNIVYIQEPAIRYSKLTIVTATSTSIFYSKDLMAAIIIYNRNLVENESRNRHAYGHG